MPRSVAHPRTSLPARAVRTASFRLAAGRRVRLAYRPTAAIDRDQRRRLRTIVKHAYEHVPYYRETLRRLGLSPRDFQSAADLARLPLLERDQLQRDPERFVPDDAPLDSYLKVQSGGSTGEPLTYYRDFRANIEQAVLRERRRRAIVEMVRKRRYRTALIVPPASSARLSLQAFYRSTLFRRRSGRTLVLSLFAPVEENVKAIDRFHPDVVGGFGSAIEDLFLHLQRTGQRFDWPRVLTCSADPVSEPVRRLITEEFGIPMLAAYPAIEAPLLGFECRERRGFHLNTDVFPVRIADSEAGDCPVGESGEVILSNLINRGTVLLNYRLGDVARLRAERCPCGRNLPLLSMIEGRTSDWLVSATGRRINSQALQFELYTEPIWRYQVVQEAPGRFRVAVVEKPGSDRTRTRERIERKFSDLFGEGTTVRLSFVQALPRSPSGKVRPIIPMAGPRPPSPAG
jgi:phenylacetate-CoA ligase